MAPWVVIKVIYVLLDVLNKTSFFNSDASKEVVQESRGGKNISELEPPTLANAREGKDVAPSPGKELHNQPIATQLVMLCLHLSRISDAIFH